MHQVRRVRSCRPSVSGALQAVRRGSPDLTVPSQHVCQRADGGAHETQREDGGQEGDNPLSKEDEKEDMPAAALQPSENSETQRGGASSETHLTCTREVRDFEGKVPVTGFYSFGDRRARGVAILVSPTILGSVGKYRHDDEGRLLTGDIVHKGKALRIANAKDSLGGTQKHQPWKDKGL
ncbi:unnamed protein product, partial [Ixodes pacificus]